MEVEVNETTAPPRRIGWPIALTGSAVAALAALWLMFWVRNTFQIRTLPERAMEYALLYVPPDQFEAAVTRFGPDAKVYALYGATIVLALVLLGLGALALRAGGTAAIWALGAALWLVAMVGVIPLTGGGLFGTDLPQDALLVNVCFAALALLWVTALLAIRALVLRPPADAAALDRGRRALLAGGVGTVASFATMFALRNRLGGSDLPLATFELAEPTPAPVAAAVIQPSPNAPPASSVATSGAPASTTAPRAIATATPMPAAAAAPTEAPKPTAAPNSDIPQPPPPRQIKREHDGASTAVPRKNGELAKLITPNDDFYITTKNPVSDPVVDGATWRLVLDGEVAKPVQLDYRTLRRLPSVELVRTLECISNFVDKPELAPFGNNLISTATWKGVRLKDVLGLAGGLKDGAKWITLITADEFNAVIPAEAADDPECILAYEMNGQVLPREHGYPTRLLMPGRYGLKSAKWVIAIRPQQKESVDWYGQRGWSKEGVAKTMSRIDVPGVGEVLQPGPQKAAGIAYGANRGIAKVELSADGGKSWRPAELTQRPETGKETWVFWQAPFQMPEKGGAMLRVRATDGEGTLQIEEFSLPQPNGSSGWHTVEVKSPA